MSKDNTDKINIGEIISKAKGKSNDSASESDINAFLNDNLSRDQAERVKSVLGDEEKTRTLLNSDAAKALLEKFFGGKGNG